MAQITTKRDNDNRRTTTYFSIGEPEAIQSREGLEQLIDRIQDKIAEQIAAMVVNGLRPHIRAGITSALEAYLAECKEDHEADRHPSG